MGRARHTLVWFVALGLGAWGTAQARDVWQPELSDANLVTLSGESPEGEDLTGSLDTAQAGLFDAALAGRDGAATPVVACGSGRCGDSCCGKACCGNSCCRDCCGPPRLFGLIAPSDRCFNDFVSPISNPLFFEDPRTLSELRPMYINHSFPRTQPVLGGGDASVFACQIRAALTQRLSVIATKDGYIDLNTPGIGTRSGWAATAAGVKYNLIRRPQQQFLLSTGLVYELASGEADVFQGLGDGEFHLFLSGAARPFENVFWINGAGFRLPSDTRLGSQMFYWSNSVALRLLEGARPSTGWYALWETNWFHWYNSGNAFPFNFEGADLINFGSNNVNGNNIVTMLAGLKWKPFARLELGAGWEFKVAAQDEDLYGHRTYVQANLRY